MRVLFVCSENAHRSPLAEAMMKKLRPDLEVDSAGIHAAIPISKEAKKYLAKDYAEQYLKQNPEDLGNKQLDEYDLIVAMEQRHKQEVLRKCPKCERKIVVWNIRDPYGMSHNDALRVYNEIEEKVKELAKST